MKRFLFLYLPLTMKSTWKQFRFILNDKTRNKQLESEFVLTDFQNDFRILLLLFFLIQYLFTTRYDWAIVGWYIGIINIFTCNHRQKKYTPYRKFIFSHWHSFFFSFFLLSQFFSSNDLFDFDFNSEMCADWGLVIRWNGDAKLNFRTYFDVWDGFQCEDLSKNLYIFGSLFKII